MKRTLAILIILTATTPLAAQWITLPTPQIPRTADGEADLSAPAPRLADGRPDFTGLYRLSRSRSDLSDPANLQGWVRTLRDERARRFFADNPRFHCLPEGPANLMGRGNSYGLRRIVHHPNLMVQLFNDGSYREIFIDGRELEENPLPTWMGYAVGHWEGDTLVVESNGYNNKTRVSTGISHTDQLRMTERYTRSDFGHVQIEVTYVDPGAFVKPLTASLEWRFAVDEVMLETVCAEAYGGERSTWTSDFQEVGESTVQVAPEILEKYVGTYQGIYLGSMSSMEVTLEAGGLFLTKGTSRRPMLPQSETAFVVGGFGYVFTVGDDGMASTISEVHVSGAWPFERVD